MVRGGAVGHKQLSVKTESGEFVADALFGFRRRGLDGPSAKFRARGSLLCQRSPLPGSSRREFWVYFVLVISVSVLGLAFS